MNIFHKTAVQELKKNRTRTFVTIIGVVLSTALITAVSTFGISLLHYLAEGAAQKYGGWHIAFSGVSASFVKERMQDDEALDAAAFEEIGYARLSGSKNPDKPYCFIAGCSEKALDTLPIHIVSGRMPKNSREVLVSSSAAENGGVKILPGDTIQLAVGERISGGRRLGQHDPYVYENETLNVQEKITYTAVGIYERPSFEEYRAPGYTFLTKAKEHQADGGIAAGDAGLERFTVFVTLKNPYKVKHYAKTVPDGAAYVLNDDVLRFMGLSENDFFNSMLYAVGGIVIFIIMTASVFLIYNAFHISLNERMHQFGILLSVGASKKQLRGSVLFEGLCIGVSGIPAGILLGLAGIRAVIYFTVKSFRGVMYDSVPLTLVVSAPVLAAAALLSLVTILISAYIPARRAAAVPVMECLKQTNEIKMDLKSVKTPKYTARIYGLEGMLALKNFKRNRKRHRSIVLSLVLSIVLFISADSFILDLKQAMGDAEFMDYDIGFAVQDMEDTEMLQLYEQMKDADSVMECSYQALMTFSAETDAAVLTDDFRKSLQPEPSQTAQLSVEIQFLEDGAYRKLLEENGMKQDADTGQDPILPVSALMEDARQKNASAGIFAADTVEITLMRAEGGKTQAAQPVTLAPVEIKLPDALFASGESEAQPYRIRAAAPYSLKEKLAGADAQADVKGITLRSENSRRTADALRRIIMEHAVTADYELYNISELFEQERNQIFIADVFSYTFIVLISLIAAANVFHTISTNIRLRRRELVMLRSVGMSQRSFQKMMNFECALYGMRALMFGLPAALAASYFIYLFLQMDAEGISYTVPWAGIGISTGSVLIVISAAMMYAVSSIKKVNIIDALRDDMA